MLHLKSREWTCTADGAKRGYIQPEGLNELWFHLGSKCNLSCDFCFEDSGPLSERIGQLFFKDAKRYIDEALNLSVKRFSFTGGEPFMARDIIEILDYALDHKPCLVLTNGTAPTQKKLSQVAYLKNKPNLLKFRLSLDSPYREVHDAGRGAGNFRKTISTLKKLHQMGFEVSIACIGTLDCVKRDIEKVYGALFEEHSLPPDMEITVFPYLSGRGITNSLIPEITEDCMRKYCDSVNRDQFMCNTTKMIVKKEGETGVFACTLVDDDDIYNLSETLTDALKYRVMLRPPRCFTCFSSGVSCGGK